MSEELLIERDKSLAVVTMNRAPDNRYNLDFVNEIISCLETLEKDDKVKAVVIASQIPKFFGNGLDLQWIQQQSRESLLEYFRKVNEMLAKTVIFKKPTVGCLTGHTFGMTAIWACCLDFLVMNGEKGWFCFPEVDLNVPLTPGMLACIQRILTPYHYNKLVLTSYRMTGEEAQKAGIVEAVAAPDNLLTSAKELATKLTTKPSWAYSTIKERMRIYISQILMEVDEPYIVQIVNRLKPE